MHVLGRYAKAYAICAGVFCLLMVLVSLVPKALIRQQVEESTAILVEEGDYPAAWPTMHESPDALDSFTTSLSLNIAIHTVENPLMGAILCPPYSDPSATTMADALAKGIDKPAQSQYFHYWHGYLVLLVPLLAVFNIAQIRKVFLLVAMLLCMAVAAKMGKRSRVGVALAWGMALLFSNIWVVAESTAQFFCYLVGLAATLYVTCKSQDNKRLGEDVTGPFFFVVGAITVFLDFLDTPIVSLGLPLATYVVMRERSILEGPILDTLKRLLILAVSWALGYALLWMTKWGIGLVVLGAAGVDDLLFVFTLRSSGQSTGGEAVSRIEILRRNVAMMVPGWMMACAKVLGVAWVALTCLFHRNPWWKLCLCLVAVAILPVLWYFVLPNHALDHTFFTYRSLCVSVYAMGIMVVCLTDWQRLKACAVGVLPWRAKRDQENDG